MNFYSSQNATDKSLCHQLVSSTIQSQCLQTYSYLLVFFSFELSLNGFSAFSTVPKACMNMLQLVVLIFSMSLFRKRKSKYYDNYSFNSAFAFLFTGKKTLRKKTSVDTLMWYSCDILKPIPFSFRDFVLCRINCL